MSEQSIICPNCKKRILLSKALTGQIEEDLRKEFDSELRRHDKDAEDKFKLQLASEKRKVESKIKDKTSIEITELRQQVQEKEKELKNSRKQELEFRKRERELETKEKSVELEISKKVGGELKRVEEEVKSKIIEDNRVKDLEKDKQLADLRKQINDLKHKAEQGSQQTQGEAIEEEVEEMLKASFPYDEIEPVAKGVKGADIIQRVHNATGQYCGTIVWESKNTKTWNDGWITKLKDDQRSIKAEIAVLISVVLPKEVNHFGQIEGIWITDISSSMGLACALRATLIQVTMTRQAAEGKKEKLDMLFEYLTGNEFKQRVEAMVESFSAMKEDLEREKHAMEATWAKREKQIQKVIKNVAGMYGDMQGLVGTTLPKIEYLELPGPTSQIERLEGN